MLAALAEIDAKAIGVPVATPDAIAAMELVAQWTDSWVDLNENGSPDPGEWMVYPTTDYAITPSVVQGIQEFTQFVTYDLTMDVEDPSGAIADVDPAVMTDVPAQNTVQFTVTIAPDGTAGPSVFSNTVYMVPTTLYGDDGVILAEWDLSFVVTPSAPTTTGS